MGFDENQMEKISKQKLKSDCPSAQLLKSFVERLFSVSLRRSKSKCRRLRFVCMCVSVTAMMLMLLICATNDLMMIFKLSYKWSIIWSKIVISTSFFLLLLTFCLSLRLLSFLLRSQKGQTSVCFFAFAIGFFFVFFINFRRCLN